MPVVALRRTVMCSVGICIPMALRGSPNSALKLTICHILARCKAECCVGSIVLMSRGKRLSPSVMLSPNELSLSFSKI